MDLIEWVLVTAVVLFLAALGLGVYDYFVAEKFALRKDQWSCTQSHAESYTYFQQVGNVSIPMTGTTQVCDQWSRR
jgi:hypothetical protein